MYSECTVIESLHWCWDKLIVWKNHPTPFSLSWDGASAALELALSLILQILTITNSHVIYRVDCTAQRNGGVAVHEWPICTDWIQNVHVKHIPCGWRCSQGKHFPYGWWDTKTNTKMGFLWKTPWVMGYQKHSLCGHWVSQREHPLCEWWNTKNVHLVGDWIPKTPTVWVIGF